MIRLVCKSTVTEELLKERALVLLNIFCSLPLSLSGASIAQCYCTGLLVNRSSDRSCTRSTVHNKMQVAPAQYSLTSAELWPKTPFISISLMRPSED